MTVTVNGETKQLPDAQAVSDLIEALGLSQRPVAVEVNRRLVPKSQHGTVVLKDGDTVELVTLVGGG